MKYFLNILWHLINVVIPLDIYSKPYIHLYGYMNKLFHKKTIINHNDIKVVKQGISKKAVPATKVISLEIKLHKFLHKHHPFIYGRTFIFLTFVLTSLFSNFIQATVANDIKYQNIFKSLKQSFFQGKFILINIFIDIIISYISTAITNLIYNEAIKEDKIFRTPKIKHNLSKFSKDLYKK